MTEQYLDAIMQPDSEVWIYRMVHCREDKLWTRAKFLNGPLRGKRLAFPFLLVVDTRSPSPHGRWRYVVYKGLVYHEEGGNLVVSSEADQFTVLQMLAASTEN